MDFESGRVLYAGSADVPSAAPTGAKHFSKNISRFALSADGDVRVPSNIMLPNLKPPQYPSRDSYCAINRSLL